MAQISLDDGRRNRLLAEMQRHMSAEYDISLSKFQAEGLLDMLLKTLGPEVYNQAVKDARAHMQVKLDDLDGEIWIEPGV